MADDSGHGLLQFGEITEEATTRESRMKAVFKAEPQRKDEPMVRKALLFDKICYNITQWFMEGDQEQLEAVVGKTPKAVAEALVYRAQQYYYQGKYEEALNTYLEVTKSGLSEAEDGLARCYIGLNRHLDAKRYLLTLVCLLIGQGEQLTNYLY